MKLIIQPDAGLTPVLQAVRKATKTIDVVIFRFDRTELEKALGAAVARGVAVRALIAHTNRGGEKSLRKLELRLLDAGVTVARTADDLTRYHGKMMLIDDALHVYGFNFTKLDIEASRSFGIVTREAQLVKEANALFEADCTRQPYAHSHEHFVVSPESSRALLTAFVKRAKKELLIYDAKVTDRLILRALADRIKAGVRIRLFGKTGKGGAGIETRRLPDLRLHVRAMVRDGQAVFIGSQSLRKLELDNRREVGVIVHDRRIAKQIQTVFEADWKETAEAKAEAEKGPPKELEAAISDG